MLVLLLLHGRRSWISDRFSGRELLCLGKKYAILLSTAMILTGSCVSSVAVHAQTGYAAEYAQEASAAGVQSTAKLVAKGSCGSKAVYRLYSNGNLQIQGKGEVKVTDNFSYRSAMIKTVTVASGITGIGDRTFSGCRNMKRISLPGTLRSIGVRAFGDTAITRIKLPDGLKSIGAYAFYQSKLTSLDVPKTVTKLMNMLSVTVTVWNLSAFREV